MAKKLRELTSAEEVGLYRINPTRIYHLCEEIQVLQTREEAMWKQRSHNSWLKEGDRNTRYFHCKANQRNMCNQILGLEDDSGFWVDDEEPMGAMVEEYLANIFTTFDPTSFDNILNCVAPTVTPNMNLGLN